VKSIGELIVRVANLAEAEGRVVKRNVVRVLSGSVIFLVAGALAVSGFVALCAAIFLGLSEVIHPGWALAIVSLGPLVAGLVCALIGVIVLRDGKKGR
jgi:hypothetical protein